MALPWQPGGGQHPHTQGQQQSGVRGARVQPLAECGTIDLVIQVYTNKRMLVRVYLDPRRSSTTSKSAELLQKVGIMKPLIWLTVGSFNKSSPRSQLTSMTQLPPALAVTFSCLSSEEHSWECSSCYKANAFYCAIIFTLDWTDLPQALIFYCIQCIDINQLLL